LIKAVVSENLATACQKWRSSALHDLGSDDGATRGRGAQNANIAGQTVHPDANQGKRDAEEKGFKRVLKLEKPQKR